MAQQIKVTVTKPGDLSSILRQTRGLWGWGWEGEGRLLLGSFLGAVSIGTRIQGLGRGLSGTVLASSWGELDLM